jgi:hypothetical protein
MRKALLVALVALSALAASTGTAAASNAVLVIAFDKQGSQGHYVGTACDGGTIEMQLSDSSVTGNVQSFTAVVRLECPGGRELTALLDGRFNFETGKTVLNGTVTHGWLAGAQVHEEGVLVAYDPTTTVGRFVGTIRLMPGSAN